MIFGPAYTVCYTNSDALAMRYLLHFQAPLSVLPSAYLVRYWRVVRNISKYKEVQTEARSQALSFANSYAYSWSHERLEEVYKRTHKCLNNFDVCTWQAHYAFSTRSVYERGQYSTVQKNEVHGELSTLQGASPWAYRYIPPPKKKYSWRTYTNSTPPPKLPPPPPRMEIGHTAGFKNDKLFSGAGKEKHSYLDHNQEYEKLLDKRPDLQKQFNEHKDMKVQEQEHKEWREKQIQAGLKGTWS